MNYKFLIEDMTFSYSRINSFKQCKYGFFLKYIKHCDSKNNFFAMYGTFMHTIIEKFLAKDLLKEELVSYYIENFTKVVTAKPPSSKIYKNYFNSGLVYLSNMSFPYTNILGIEEKVDFSVGDYDFVGYVDVIAKDNEEIHIIDHKSKTLKSRSKRKTPTKTDVELDEYLRQLYLYSIPIYNKYKEYPTKLNFNTFRNNSWIAEDFNLEKLEDTKKWVTNSIEEIILEEKWNPNVDYWLCKHLCDVSSECEYYSLM